MVESDAELWITTEFEALGKEIQEKDVELDKLRKRYNEIGGWLDDVMKARYAFGRITEVYCDYENARDEDSKKEKEPTKCPIVGQGQSS